MTKQAKQVRGTVKLLFCEKCGAEFPVFDYELESDTDAVGLYSAGTCGGGSLILIDLDFEEWKAAQAGKLKQLPARFAHLADRGFRMTHIVRVEQPDLPAAGGSFAEFRQAYQSPVVIYSCPCCGGGEAVAQSEVSVAEYVNAGREIHAIEPLRLNS